MSQGELTRASTRVRAVAVAMGGLFFLLATLWISSAPSGEPGKAGLTGDGTDFNSSRVMGHAACVDCHRTEVAAWQRMKHAKGVFDLLLGPAAREYAEKLNIPAEEITHSSLCVDCHATRTQNYLGHDTVIAGVTCEACHNPAGGPDGWLNAHAVYGPVGTRRDDEAYDHYVERVRRCRSAGQIRPDDLYAMSKRCLACHLVGDEELVNEGGHKLGGVRFELLKNMSGEVRHNSHLNQRENEIVSSLWLHDLRHEDRNAEARMATVYVVGQLVKAELALRHLATAEDPEGDYAVGLAELFDATLGNLEDTDVDELVDVADKNRDLCDRLLDGDFETGDEEIVEAAESFSSLAQEYAAGNGDGLEDVELPNIDEELAKAYQP